MPPHRAYIEPFLGGGGVFRMKRPAAVNIGLDLDPEVIARWILPPDLAAVDVVDPMPPKVAIAGVSGFSDADPMPVFLSALEDVGGGRRPGVVELAASVGRVLVDRRRRRRSPDLAAAAVVSGSGGGGAIKPPGGAIKPPGGAGEFGGARSRWAISAGDGLAFLAAYPFQGDELVYCDPPYLLETRSSGPRYACEMSDGAHRKLVRLVKRLPCRVMLSGYWSELYGRALAGWRHLEFEVMTRGGMATEHLWMNFPPPVELHDYRYLGANRREREKLKRQKTRWVARLGRMPELQRAALLAAIQEYSASVSDGGARGGVESGHVVA